MSDLKCEPDWDAAKERWSAWWDRHPTRGPLLSIRAPRERTMLREGSEPAARGTMSWWLDVDEVLRRDEAAMASTVYIGEAFPFTSACLGPGSMGTFLGAEPQFADATVWYEPCYTDVRDAVLKFDRSSRWWRWTLDFTRQAIERARGRYLVAMPDLIENLDTLAALLGTEELLCHLVDHAEEVHRLQQQLLPLWFQAYDGIYDMIRDPDGGVSWLGFMAWAPGRLAKVQCDFSAMISEDMFGEFVLPYLTEQCDMLDYTLYHLDGPEAVRHLDHLLSIESLDCIQWTPGAGTASGGDPCWDDIYRRTLDAGKLIHAGMPPAEVLPFVTRFGRQSVYIVTSTSSEAEAKQLIMEVRGQ